MQRGFAPLLILVGLLITAVIAGGGYYFYSQRSSAHNQQKVKNINSFEECAKLYPVALSYPAQCWTPDGRHFVQELSDEEKKKLAPPSSDETENWKTFNNSNISFKYPNDWNIEDKTNVVTVYGPNQKFPNQVEDPTYKYFPFYVGLVKHANTENLEEKDWAKKNIITYCSGEVTKSPLSFEDFKIGEVIGTKVKALDIPPTLVSKRGDQIWTFSINVGYCDGGSPVDEDEPITKSHINIFNQILSTFKFLE